MYNVYVYTQTMRYTCGTEVSGQKPQRSKTYNYYREDSYNEVYREGRTGDTTLGLHKENDILYGRFGFGAIRQTVFKMGGEEE